MQPEPLFDLAHFAHCELFTPKPNESLWFFTHVLSLQVVEQRGQSVYLRAYGDTPRATLKLTESPKPGMGHAAFRAISATALQRRVHALEAGGVKGRWIDGDFGHGAAYQFDDPDGHRFEIFYEAEAHATSEANKPYLKNQAERYPQSGARVRTLDHLNLLAAQVTPNKEFMREHLGFRLSEHIVLDDGTEAGAWLRVTSKSYDLVYTADALGAHNRLHHLAFRMDNREDVLRAADLYTENGIKIENGPGKHPIGQTFFLYAYEPGGNRIEVCAGGYMIFAPDWQPVRWTQAERARGQAWGAPTVSTFHTYGTPMPADADTVHT
jgi:catechol 2,3-dioxygenase